MSKNAPILQVTFGMGEGHERIAQRRQDFIDTCRLPPTRRPAYLRLAARDKERVAWHLIYLLHRFSRFAGHLPQKDVTAHSLFNDSMDGQPTCTVLPTLGRLSEQIAIFCEAWLSEFGRVRDSIVRRTGVLLLAALTLAGCSVTGAPSFVLFGAFFPAWMLCASIGVIGAVAARAVFVGTGLSNALPHQLLICAAMGTIAATLTWLIWFGW